MKYRSRKATQFVRRAALLLGAALSGLSASAQHFDFVSNGVSLAPGITPAMFLSNENVAQVDAFLSTQSVKAVKIYDNLSSETVAAIYGKYKIDFTFADYESADYLQRTTTLVEAIRNSAVTGPAFAANEAFVSNFHVYPGAGDGTGQSLPSAHYIGTGVNMSSPNLYPGSPTFRNPASGDSSAPNIRSALFTLPIARQSAATSGLPSGHKAVPYVNRFNNWGNGALDSDGDPSNGFAFVTSDQLPSRGDFKAQVLHYRLRGASAVQGLDGAVQGYSQTDFMNDMVEGWNGVAAVNDVLADPKSRLATLDTTVKTDGDVKSIEDAGVVFSGAYSIGKSKMVLLVSNMDEIGHTLSFPTRIGGKSVAGEVQVAPGMHYILEYGAAGSTWNLASSNPVFTDLDRGGVGIPEPGALGLIALGAMLLGRRRSWPAR